MKYICFTCEECDCRFAIDESCLKDEPACPNCVSEVYESTGECIQNPKIVFDRDGST